MPEGPTTDEFVVTAYVNNNYGGESYTSEIHNGAEYRTYENHPNERWVDTDRDGWLDYGLRDEGYGHWSRFDGWQWKDSNGNVVHNQHEDGGNGFNASHSSMETDGWLF
jgi:hypothetical protein